MQKATFRNGEAVLFDHMRVNGDDYLFFRGTIGLVHAQHKDNIEKIEIVDDNSSTTNS